MNKRMLVGFFACIALLYACSEQGEGERCETSSNDCKSGLVCTSAALLQTTYDLCCPADRGSSSVTACKGVSAVVTQPEVDATSTDTGVGDTGVADTGSSNDATAAQ